MKLELCQFSGYKIPAGHGKRFVRIDGKVYNFITGKCARSLAMRRNPRKCAWTVVYRRKHKKGTVEETARKRTRRNVKFVRAIHGATLESILQKKNQKPEVRKAQREQAIRAAKEKAEAKKRSKHAVASKAALKSQTKQQARAPKNVKGGAKPSGGRRF